jgi:hypothetical protein
VVVRRDLDLGALDIHHLLAPGIFDGAVEDLTRGLV